MQYALVDGIRAEATKGSTGVCPGCGRPVIAKCGEIMVHHWAHQAEEGCEFTREPMTSWHLNWQRQYPEEMREVHLAPHRADVMTPHYVLEFQHSSISKEAVDSRNAHWSKTRQVIWVLNMKGVAKNAKTWGAHMAGDPDMAFIAGQRRSLSFWVEMARRNNALCTHDHWVAFHDEDNDRIYMGKRNTRSGKDFRCYRFNKRDFIEMTLLNNWITEHEWAEKQRKEKLALECDFPAGPRIGEQFTWRKRTVCYMGMEEMYFSDDGEAPLNAQQRAMALHHYMTPVRATHGNRENKVFYACTKAERLNNRRMYEEELKRARRETRLGEVIGDGVARV